MPLPPHPLIFTVRFNGLSNVLQSSILVGPPVNPASVLNDDILSRLAGQAKEYIGIWDTGATNSVISDKVVDECRLKPTGIARVTTASESVLCETFLISIFLPNKVVMPVVRVTKGRPGGCDLLIGMDIIGTGDFAVSNFNGRTTFSFRMPSTEEIDFIKTTDGSLAPVPSPTKISRNAPCPCGSGKKYKKCCGR